VSARTATLATIRPDGRPRLVPICFVLAPFEHGGRWAVHTPLDEKPKSVDDPAQLARVRDIRARPEVALLVERWSEDWSKLSWVRLEGRAELIEPDPLDTNMQRMTRAVIKALRDKYPQYEEHHLADRPMIMISGHGATSWRSQSPRRCAQ